MYYRKRRERRTSQYFYSNFKRSEEPLTVDSTHRQKPCAYKCKCYKMWSKSVFQSGSKLFDNWKIHRLNIRENIFCGKNTCLFIAIFQRHHTKDSYRYKKLPYAAEMAVTTSSKTQVQNRLLCLLQKDYFFFPPSLWFLKDIDSVWLHRQC